MAVFGPGAEAARIEGSKSFAKDVLRAAGVPTAEELAAPRAPCVVKADGLAAGKGVFVCETEAELAEALPRASALGGSVVVEELLEGREVSLFALCDGERALTLAPAQDFKRLLDDDRGPNTGGMGSYSPVPWLEAGRLRHSRSASICPCCGSSAPAARRSRAFCTPASCLPRTGPECSSSTAASATRRRRRSSHASKATCSKRWRQSPRGRSQVELAAGPESAVTVVLAAAGYPDAPESGAPIVGLDEAEAAGGLVFHAGTAVRSGELVATGGRVLAVTALGESVGEARERAYRAVEQIELSGVQYRQDIALAAVHAHA